MAKPKNRDLRNRILAFLRLKYYENGKKPFKCSLTEIAEAVEGKRGEKVWYYIKDLARAGRIEVEFGAGRASNRYISVEDESISELSEIQNSESQISKSQVSVSELQEYDKKNEKNIGDYFLELNKTIVDIGCYMKDHTNESMKYFGQVKYLENMLRELEMTGTTPNGEYTFRASRGSMLPTVLDKLQKVKYN
jgi:hypothetical protein